MPARRPKRGGDFDALGEIALARPDAEESTSSGPPAFKGRGKLFVRFEEDGESIVVRCDRDPREALLRGDPGVFRLTDHDRGSSMLLVSLPHVDRVTPAQVVKERWRRVAPKGLQAQLDAGESHTPTDGALC